MVDKEQQFFREASKSQEYINIFGYNAPSNKLVFDTIEKKVNAKARAILKQNKNVKDITLPCLKCFKYAFNLGKINDDVEEVWNRCQTLEFKHVQSKTKAFEERHGKTVVITDLHLDFECFVCGFRNSFGFEKMELPPETLSLIENE